VKFRRSYITKDAVFKVHNEAEFSLLLVPVQYEGAGGSRACLLGVSWLQCTCVMQCNPKGQPD
jgi:hypothetical protein